MGAAGGPSAVAGRSGIPLGSLKHHLDGRAMKPAALVALADACNVSLEWLAAGRGPMRPGEQLAPPSGPTFFKLFGTVDMETMAQAMEVAALTFQAKGFTPSWRRMAQVVTLIYDTLKEPEADDTAVQRALSEAEDENR